MKKLFTYLTALLITLCSVQLYAQCCPVASGEKKGDKTLSKETVKDDKQAAELYKETSAPATTQKDTQKKDN